MRFIQREMIATYFPKMDAGTQARALRTMRWLESEGV